MKSKDTKQRLFEVMKRVAPNFTGKALNESESDYEEDRYSRAPEDSMANQRKEKDWSQYGKDPHEIDYDSDKPEEDVDEISTGLANAAASKVNPATPQQPVAEKFNKWGKSQDDWANIEGGHTERGKDLQKKANIEKKEPQGGGDTPEYMNTYDSEKPQSNINNLSQTQIDKTNADKRGDMERDVRKSIDREDGMYEGVKKKDTKQRLFEVMARLDKTFKPKLNESDAFNDAGEPLMTHQQYRDYSEPSEPEYDDSRNDYEKEQSPNEIVDEIEKHFNTILETYDDESYNFLTKGRVELNLHFYNNMVKADAEVDRTGQKDFPEINVEELAIDDLFQFFEPYRQYILTGADAEAAMDKISKQNSADSAYARQERSAMGGG